MTIHPVAFLLLVLSPLLLVSCADDIAYWSDNGHYYQFVPLSSPITYDAAKTLAASKSHNSKTGYVVTIGSATEQAFLMGLMGQINVDPGSSDYPTIWAGATKSGDSWVWQAAGRVSNPFFNSKTLACAVGAYCNWISNTSSAFNTSMACSQIFMNNTNPYNTSTPGTWRPAACGNVSQALVIEYDQSQTCSAGYSYSTSRGWCEDVNECTNNPRICGRGYKCVNTIGSYQCADIDECQNATICASGYQCVNLNGSYRCDDIDECSQTPSVCASGYTCTNSPGSYQCSDINECNLNSSLCTKGYFCTNTPGSYRCDDINECTQTGESLCPFGTKCTNTVGSYTCDSIYYMMESPWNGLFLDYMTDSQGTNRVITNTRSNSSSQLWSFTPEGFVINGGCNQVMDSEGGLSYPGVFVILWPRKPIDQASNQLWSYNSTSEFWYSRDSNPPVILDIYHAQYNPGAQICLFTPKSDGDTPQGNLNQRWNLIETTQKP